MNIIAADDERIVLASLLGTIQEALPCAAVHGFRDGNEALAFAAKNTCEIAFLDIKMRQMDGISLAKRLKKINPRVNIIFVTGYTEFTADALSLYASGYVMKPVSKEKIQQELANLRYPILAAQLPLPPRPRMRVQAFGDFEVFVDEQPLHFTSAKAKELFALLVDRRGAGMTTPQIAAVLWENEPYSTYQKNRVQQVIARLRTTLQKAGCEDVLYKERNQTAVKTDRIFCDYYAFLQGGPEGAQLFLGEYMAQYSWAEVTTSFLEGKR